MRVLVVSEPGRDGVFVYVRSLIQHIHAKHPEVEVDFAYSSVRGSPDQEELVQSVKAHGGRTLDLRITNAPGLADFGAMIRLLALLNERKPDVIHAHSSKAGVLARAFAWSPGFPPVIYSPHAYFGMPKKGGAKERFFNGLESLFGRFGTTHNCSEDERDFAIEDLGLDPRHLVLIHNGVNTDLYSPADESAKRACRDSLGIPREGKLLVTVGRDSEQKNYAPLYSALDAFLSKGGVLFGHAGAGSVGLRDCLSPVANARCYAFDHLDNPSLLLRAADGFILTSRYEGLSFSMLHALSCQLPMLLTEAPGLRVLRQLGFRDIQWLPDPATAKNLTSDIARALEEWKIRPCEQLDAQRDLACKLFTESVQLEKMFDLQCRVAGMK